METVQPEKLGFSGTRLARIHSVMQRFVNEGKFAGILTLIARRGQVVHFDRVGMRDMETGKPVEEDTIFRIYSMTKPITTVAAMMLYEEGHFRLLDPLYEYLPEFKGIQIGESGGERELKLVPPVRPITIHDLLTHTAGLGYGDDENNAADKILEERLKPLSNDRGKNALRDFVRVIAGTPFHHQPGQFFHYSYATDVLGCLVEVLSGMSFGDFLHKRIFEPLGMVDTAFSVAENKLDRFALMYGPVEEGGIAVPGKLKNIDPVESSRFLHHDRRQSGGGGLVSTAPDYLRFCQMLLNHGEIKGERLLGRKTVELMRINHLPAGKYIFDDGVHGFGLGGYVLLNPAWAGANGSVGNWGWGGVANTFFWLDFQEEMIPIIMIQYQPFQAYNIEDVFKNLVYQAMI
jgi:CubicO group peptidase (beta-lactamase class C family)